MKLLIPAIEIACILLVAGCVLALAVSAVVVFFHP